MPKRYLVLVLWVGLSALIFLSSSHLSRPSKKISETPGLAGSALTDLPISQLTPQELLSLCNLADYEVEIAKFPGDLFSFSVPNDLMYPVRPVEIIAWFNPSSGTVQATINGTKSPLKPLAWRPDPITGWNYSRNISNTNVVVVAVSALKSDGMPLFGCGVWQDEPEPEPEDPSPSRVVLEKRVAMGNRSPAYCRDNWNNSLLVSSDLRIPVAFAPNNYYVTFCYKVTNVGNASGTAGLKIKVLNFKDEFISAIDPTDDKNYVEGCVVGTSNTPVSLWDMRLGFQETAYCKLGLGQLSSNGNSDNSYLEISTFGEIRMQDTSNAITTSGDSARVVVSP